MAANQPATLERNRPGSPPFHSTNDDLRVRFGRTRDEYVELHQQLTAALEADTASSFQVFDRAWSDLVNVMDDRDYWETRCLRYHTRYLAEAARAREYKELVRAFQRDNSRLRSRITDLQQEIGVLQVELDERADRDVILEIERSLADDIDAVLTADELRESNGTVEDEAVTNGMVTDEAVTNGMVTDEAVTNGMVTDEAVMSEASD